MREEEQRKTTSATRALFSSQRLWVRDLLLPMILSETSRIADFQQRYRTPLLDMYFTMISFIGSHTFYMLILPTSFWFGMARYARQLTILLAMALFVVNIVKDWLCLPRPASPPVVKLSSDYKMEYGFPSAHSINALNMAVFSTLYFLQNADPAPSWLTQVVVWTICIMFLISICISRVYCGMHSVTDIMGGLFFGAILLGFWLTYYRTIDTWLTTGDNVIPYCVAFSIFLVIIYPDPVDPTPSFDDTVSFIWSACGAASGTSMFSLHPFSDSEHYLANVPYSYTAIGPINSLLRIVIGVGLVLIWRIVAKKICYIVLPPIYRTLDLPSRRFFLRARYYKKIDTPIQMTPTFLNLSEASKPGETDQKHAEQHQFHRIPRFDVDVLTRCIVYFGIGWLASFGNPYMFHALGLSR